MSQLFQGFFCLFVLTSSFPVFLLKHQWPEHEEGQSKSAHLWQSGQLSQAVVFENLNRLDIDSSLNTILLK